MSMEMNVKEDAMTATVRDHPQVVVLCSTEWSEPCKQMLLVMKELAVMHPTADIEESPAIQKTYNIRAVPHCLIFKEGTLVDAAEGADPSVLLEKVDALSSAEPSPEMTLTERIESLIGSTDVMLFMKGTPEAPRCGFSSKVVQALNDAQIRFSHFDILQDDAIRQGLKEYTCWPTYPQLYAGKEFLGGCDIILELQSSGQLQKEIINKTGDKALKHIPQVPLLIHRLAAYRGLEIDHWIKFDTGQELRSLFLRHNPLYHHVYKL